MLSVPLLLEKIYKKVENQIKKQLPKYANNKNFIASLPFPILQIVKYKVNKTLGGRVRDFIVGAAPLNPDLATYRQMEIHHNAFFGQFLTHSMHSIHSVPFFLFLELSVTSTPIGHTLLHFPHETQKPVNVGNSLSS